jgi:hypothetical protein
MKDEKNHDRRRFLSTAAMTIATAHLGMLGTAQAQSRKTAANTSFGTLKQIDAGFLNIGYAEAGPADGRAVILLHGWPYDIHSYVDVAPLLAPSSLPTEPERILRYIPSSFGPIALRQGYSLSFLLQPLTGVRAPRRCYCGQTPFVFCH